MSLSNSFKENLYYIEQIIYNILYDLFGLKTESKYCQFKCCFAKVYLNILNHSFINLYFKFEQKMIIYMIYDGVEEGGF